MERKSNSLVIVLIALLLCAVAFDVYLVVTNNESNKENRNTNTEEKTTNNEQNTDNSINDLLNVFEDLIYASNENTMNRAYSNPSSKLTYVNTLKIDKFFVDNKFERYEVSIKYACDNGSWDCVYYSQIDGNAMKKDNEGYYETTFYYSPSRNIDLMTTNGIFRCDNTDCKIERKTIYEK